jgi:hypothetical protein
MKNTAFFRTLQQKNCRGMEPVRSLPPATLIVESTSTCLSLKERIKFFASKTQAAQKPSESPTRTTLTASAHRTRSLASSILASGTARFPISSAQQKELAPPQPNAKQERLLSFQLPLEGALGMRLVFTSANALASVAALDPAGPAASAGVKVAWELCGLQKGAETLVAGFAASSQELLKRFQDTLAGDRHGLIATFSPPSE